MSKNVHKKNRIVAAALLALCLIAVIAAPRVEAAFYDEAVEKLIAWNVLRGYPDGSVNAEGNITRAEFVALINRAYGYTETTAIPFTDVASTSWYHDDIAAGYAAGYFRGATPTTAVPDGVLTREQAMVLLARNMRLEEIPGEITGFSDGHEFEPYSAGYANTAVRKGLISGYADGSFRPKASITRGEMAVMLSRALGTLVNTEGDYVLGDVFGNVTINTPGVTLSNSTIAGDLYLAGGLETGDVTLENVSILGDIIVAGGGESEAGESVVLRNVDADRVVVNTMGDGIVSLRAEGNTYIENADFITDTFFQDSTDPGMGLRNIRLEGEGGSYTLAGNLEHVVNAAPDSTLRISRAEVDALVIDEKAVGSSLWLDTDATIDTLDLDTAIAVTGTGDVKQLNVNVAGTSTEMAPDSVWLRPGVTTAIAGDTIDGARTGQYTEAPHILAGWPKVAELTETGATAIFNTNKTGTVYWAVTAATYGSLDADTLLSPRGNNAVVTGGTLAITEADTEHFTDITGLTGGTDYMLSAVLVDAREERSPVGTVSFSTPDLTVPAFAGGYPYMSEITGTGAWATVMATKDSRLYWAVFDTGSATPGENDFRSGAMPQAYGYGSMDVTKNTTATFAVNNQRSLSELATYDAYFWLNDADNARSSAVQKLTFTTVDQTAPEFVIPPTLSGNATTNTARMMTSVNEDATVFWVVVRSDTTYPKAPTTATEDTDTYYKLQIANGAGGLSSGSVSAKAYANAEISISGLAPETSYTVYYVARDAAGNYSDWGSAALRTADSTALAFTSGYPRMGNITGTSAEAEVMATKNAVVYWAVFGGGSAAPAESALRSGNLSGAYGYGSLDVAQGVAASFTVNTTPLTELSIYDVYFLLYRADTGETSTVEKLAFTTADETAPTFIIAPEMADCNTTGVRLNAALDQDGTIYWAIVADGADFPKAPLMEDADADAYAVTQIVNGMGALRNGNVRATAYTDAAINITGLTPETDYVVYYVAQDAAGNNSELGSLKIRTADSNALAFTSGYPVMREVAGTSAKAAVMPTKDATVYWAVFAKGSITPSESDFLSGSLAGAFGAGSRDVTKNVETVFTVNNEDTPLTELTAYDVYFLLHKADTGESSAVVKLTFTTTDKTAPTFVTEPHVTVRDTTGVRLTAAVDEDATIYWAVVEKDTVYPKTPINSDEDPNAYAIRQIVSGMGAVKNGNVRARAFADAVLNVTGLSEDTAYTLYYVARDGAGNDSAWSSVDFRTADSVGLSFVTGYPYMSHVTATSANAAVCATRNARLYWAVLPEGSVAPKENDFRGILPIAEGGFASNDFPGALGFGVMDVTKNVSDILLVNNLEDLTELDSYDAYFWLEDAESRLVSNIRKLTFTAVDATPPVFITKPTVTGVDARSAGLTATINEDGTIYWAIVKKGAAFPQAPLSESEDADEYTVLQIVNGMGAVKNGSVRARAYIDAAFNITGLDADTEYTVYYAAKDAEGNNSEWGSVDFRTTDSTALGFASGYPVMGNITGTTAEAEVMPTRDATLYWVVFPAGSATPTTTAFRAGAFEGNLGGGIMDVTRELVSTFTVNDTPLTEKESYDIYFWLEDAENDLSSRIVKLTFTTVDETPPEFVTKPELSSRDAKSVKLNASLNEDGTIYWAILETEALESGTVFPKLPIDDTQDADAYAAIQIVNGMGALKNGSVRAKAYTTATLNISGLTDDKDYTVFYVARDSAGNDSEWGKLEVRTADSVALNFATGYPFLSEVTGSSAKATVMPTRNAKLYWAVFEQGSVAPTENDFRSITATADGFESGVFDGAFGYGSMDVTKNQRSSDILISNQKYLVEESTYDAYFWLEDAARGMTSAVRKLTFTAVDATPPVFITPPTQTAADAKSVTLTAAVNEDATVYWSIVYHETEFPKPPEDETEDAGAYAIRQIVNGMGAMNHGNVRARAYTDVRISIGNLAEDTEYDVYYVAMDGEGNYSIWDSVTVRTADSTGLTFADGPEIINITKSSADAKVMSTRNGTLYWAVFPEGSVAPKESEFLSITPTVKDGKSTFEGEGFSGALGFGSKEMIKNLTETFQINNMKDLVELDTYDAYFWLNDAASGLKSKIEKRTFTTRDQTPPEFIDKPTKESVDRRTITFSTRVNEDVTLYYVAVANAIDNFTEGATERLTDEQIANKIIAGGTGSGRATVKANAMTNFTVRSLAAETLYNIYYVAVDAAGNHSEWGVVTQSTLDTTPPSVEMYIPQNGYDDITGKPLASASIDIIFSEPVQWYPDRNTRELYGLDTMDSRKLLTLYENRERDMETYLAALRDAIQLMNGENSTVPVIDRANLTSTADDSWVIDYRKATVMEDEGEIVVHFGNDTGALNMKAGDTYQFLIQNIRDTADTPIPNELKTTRLDAFTTSGAYVILETIELDEKIPDTGKEITPDLVYTMTPHATLKANPNMRWDMQIWLDTTATFELYYREPGATAWTKASGAGTPRIDAGSGMKGQSLRYNLLEQREQTAYPTVVSMQQDQTYEYAIRFTSVNGQTDRENWGDTVKVKVTVTAAANGLTLLNLNTNVTETRYKEAISNGNIIELHNKALEQEITFPEGAAPRLTSVSITPGDTYVNFDIKLNRTGTVYCVVAPVGIVTTRKDGADVVWDNVPTAFHDDTWYIGDIASGYTSPYYVSDPSNNYVASGYMTEDSSDVKAPSSFPVTAGAVSTTITVGSINDQLKTETPYYAYFVIKGTGEVYTTTQIFRFTTGRITRPNLDVRISGLITNFKSQKMNAEAAYGLFEIGQLGNSSNLGRKFFTSAVIRENPAADGYTDVELNGYYREYTADLPVWQAMSIVVDPNTGESLFDRYAITAFKQAIVGDIQSTTSVPGCAGGKNSVQLRADTPNSADWSREADLKTGTNYFFVIAARNYNLDITTVTPEDWTFRSTYYVYQADTVKPQISSIQDAGPGEGDDSLVNGLTVEYDKGKYLITGYIDLYFDRNLYYRYNDETVYIVDPASDKTVTEMTYSGLRHWSVERLATNARESLTEILKIIPTEKSSDDSSRTQNIRLKLKSVESGSSITLNSNVCSEGSSYMGTPGQVTIRYDEESGNIVVSVTNSWTSISGARVELQPLSVTGVPSISLSTTNVTTNIGETRDITAIVTVDRTAAEGENVTWTVGSTSIATIGESSTEASSPTATVQTDSNGRATIYIKGVAEGTTTLTATAYGVSASCNVTITAIPVTSITVDHTTVDIVAGTGSATVNVSADENATNKDLTYSVSDGSLFTVEFNQNPFTKAYVAIITLRAGVTSGTATITFRAMDGSSAVNYCVVTISPTATGG